MRLSLVDHVSFLAMNRREVRSAFAFDSGFMSVGFQILGA
jgi:predicted nucleic acid-binding protein